MPEVAAIFASLPEPVRSSWDSVQFEHDLEDLSHFPARLQTALKDVSSLDLSRTYRPGAWTVAQLVHHLFDSHLQSYSRTKFALCESTPPIKPYDENVWVLTPECDLDSVLETVELVELLHRRWVRLFGRLDESQRNRSFHHPERRRDFVLFEQAGIYAWHGTHHLAQICQALRRPMPA